MNEIKNVVGTEKHARDVIVDVDTVYIHENINRLDNGMYEYDEQQFTKDEFLEFLYSKVKELERKQSYEQTNPNTKHEF